MNENQANSEPENPCFLSRRQQVAALLVAHLGLAYLASAVNSWIGPNDRNDLPEYLIRQLLIAGVFGFQVGQIALLASWVAFADLHWLVRFPRFFALTAWALLLGFLGEYVVEGESSKLLVEEHSAYMFLLLISPVVVLFSFRAASGRRFMPCDIEQVKNVWQFSTRRLLLVTAESAALLAIGRIVLPRYFRGAEIWTGLTGNRPEELIPVVVSATVLPVVFFGLARQRTWQRHLAIGLYFLLPALGLAWVQLSYLSKLFGLDPLLDWWPTLALILLEYLLAHICAAGTILYTFYLLRRIGYDFRRRDDGPRGRSSSNARNSAASASA